jgi:hypothetical protein
LFATELPALDVSVCANATLAHITAKTISNIAAVFLNIFD